MSAETELRAAEAEMALAEDAWIDCPIEEERERFAAFDAARDRFNRAELAWIDAGSPGA